MSEPGWSKIHRAVHRGDGATYAYFTTSDGEGKLWKAEPGLRLLDATPTELATRRDLIIPISGEPFTS